MNGLTAREEQALDFITHFIRARGFAPSIREIARALGMRSPATAEGYVQALITKGRLVREKQTARSLRVVK